MTKGAGDQRKVKHSLYNTALVKESRQKLGINLIKSNIHYI
jgi:hypothetical protein